MEVKFLIAGTQFTIFSHSARELRRDLERPAKEGPIAIVGLEPSPSVLLRKSTN